MFVPPLFEKPLYVIQHPENISNVLVTVDPNYKGKHNGSELALSAFISYDFGSEVKAFLSYLVHQIEHSFQREFSS